jgi:cell division protein FtsL
MASVTKDDLWKVFSLIMSALVLPLAGWVWNTNLKVAELQNDLGDAEQLITHYEKKFEDLDENGKRIISIEKDIEYMKTTLGRIEEIITRRDR